jgi:hypothetical protein
MAFVAFNKGGLDIFVLKDPERKEMADLPLTRFAKRLAGEDDMTFVERQRERGKAVTDSSAELAAPEPEPVSRDTIAGARKIEQWISDQMTLAAAEAKSAEAQDGADGNGEAGNGENGSGDNGEEDAGESADHPWERELKVNKYKLKFRPEFFAANAGFDTFYGVSSYLAFSMSDVMGDHRATLVTSLSFSLKDSDVFLGYEYLKRRTDYAAQLFHTRLFFFSGGVLNADRYYGAAFVLARPFNRFSRLEFGTRLVTISRERLGQFGTFVGGGFFGGPTRGESGVTISTTRAAIAEAALVDDNTVYGMFGPESGRRARLSVEGSGGGMRFLTVQGDYRKYAKILDNYTFGLRLSGGTGWGPNRTRFFLGGVNNPINPTFTTIANVPADETFFSSFMWPLRGSDLFGMAGDSFVLANVAFRFPLFHRLEMGWPLPLFFQNVQGELFFDVVSAFDRGQFDPWEARDGGFELRDLQAGYGLGVRVNLGLFLFRYDLAWPTNLAETFHPKQYFSIDFTGLF